MSIKEKSTNFASALYLVATPIGNLDDISVRSLKLLRVADVIFCEDTRNTGQLLKLYGIAAPRLVSCHEHNEQSQVDVIIQEVNLGKIVVYVSDAGTPAISDPGGRIVQGAIQAGIDVVSVPGATAFVTALVASGLNCNEFAFLGFPPQKKGRKNFLLHAKSLGITVVLYESPYRIITLIEEIIELWGIEIELCVARELTKLHEEYLRGKAGEILQQIRAKSSVKGEFVVIIGVLSKDK
ncbi:MAG: 16S rRNA (cytidine(1402)-2'-O)-methyltransferase [Bacteroidetes bacterium]|nr:16S rRNA (cytidine(1402)-2'-O)-methyltransferase [Bacteroidota bacterium]